MKPHNCMECENSRITIQHGYCQCKVTGNCYSPIIMADKISEDCPLYNEEKQIQIVIDMPEEIYEDIMTHNREMREGGKSAYYFEGLIQNGTILPKGHGD